MAVRSPAQEGFIAVRTHRPDRVPGLRPPGLRPHGSQAEYRRARQLSHPVRDALRRPPNTAVHPKTEH